MGDPETCGRCGVPIGEGTKQTKWYFEPDETPFCRECAMAHVVHEHETIAEFEAEIKKLRERVKALETLCLRAAGYIGVRQGPEVDEEADELLKQLRGET